MLKWPSLLNLCSASAFKMIIPVTHPDFQGMYVHAERCWDEFRLTWWCRNVRAACGKPSLRNELVVLTTEWLPWLQTNWRDSGHDRFALILKTNCIRQPNRWLPTSSYNHHTLTTFRTSSLLVCLMQLVFSSKANLLSLQFVCNQGNHSVVKTTNSFLQWARL